MFTSKHEIRMKDFMGVYSLSFEKLLKALSNWYKYNHQVPKRIYWNSVEGIEGEDVVILFSNEEDKAEFEKEL